MSTLSENIKKVRHFLGWTQEKAAKEIGVKRSLYAAWEEARAKPPVTLLPTIVAVFGIIDWVGFLTKEHFDPVHQDQHSFARRADARYAALVDQLKTLAEKC